MPEINYINPNLNSVREKELCVQLSLDGFSYSIVSALDKSCLLFRYYKFNNLMLIDELVRKTESVLSIDNHLNAEFSKVDITYISQNSSIIPSEFFTTENLKKFFEFSHNLAEYDELHYSPLPAIDAYNVFSIPGYLSQIFYSTYQSVKFNHQATNLINYGIKNTVENPVILVGLNSAFFDLVVMENNKLVLSNSYQYTTQSDLIYFFLYACKQLKLDFEKANVYAFGESLTNHLLIDEIASQVNEVIVPDLKSLSSCKNLSSNQVAQFYSHFIQ
jgi:hypothetical protein